ncbi:MAG: galactose mutarotase [Treponema sp.]|jgi:aldose 1-epimerase|nr:galactose mutarotase [Treponema sp.]
MKISKKTFGILSSGKKVRLYTLKAGDLSLSISTLGATWTSLKVPSAQNGKADILLGFSSFEGFLRNKYFGVTVGRFANRIGGAKFSLRGKEYELFKNEGENSLHGGRISFSKRVWKAESYEERDGVFVRFELTSPDGDEGYPGDLKAAVSYGLTKTNELVADYQAKIDAPTPVNLTNHAYFNLAGEGSNTDVLSTEFKFYSSRYLEINDELLPTGKLIHVNGTPFDFRRQQPLDPSIKALNSRGISGFDHCFVVDGVPGDLRPFAEVYDHSSGRIMRGFTTQPGFQFFTGNNITNENGKIGSVYGKHSGFCLETQHFPDSPNRPEFPSAIFGPERSYHEKAVFAFDW